MRRVRIKVCGLREPGKAARIAKCGADAIGLVFAPDSPRWISLERAREVTNVLPPMVWAVGVFVDAQPEAMNHAAEKARLHYLQLHGNEPPEIVEALNRPVIKAFRVRDENWLAEVHNWLAGVRSVSHVAAILLDAYKPGVQGGTGQHFNWELVADARAAARRPGCRRSSCPAGWTTATSSPPSRPWNPGR